MPLLPPALLQPLRSRSSQDREGLHGKTQGGTSRGEPSRSYAVPSGVVDRAVAGAGSPVGVAEDDERRGGVDDSENTSPAKRNYRTKSQPRLTPAYSPLTPYLSNPSSSHLPHTSSSHLPVASSSSPKATIPLALVEGGRQKPMFLAKAPKPGRSSSSLPLALTLGPALTPTISNTEPDPNAHLILPSSYIRSKQSGDPTPSITAKSTKKRGEKTPRYQGHLLASPPVISAGRSANTGMTLTEAERYRALIRGQGEGEGAEDEERRKTKKKKRRKEVVEVVAAGGGGGGGGGGGEGSGALGGTGTGVATAPQAEEGRRSGVRRTRTRRETRRSSLRGSGGNVGLGLARNASMMRRNVWDDVPELETSDGGSGSAPQNLSEPPPPFPYPTPSTVRLPPAFGSVVGSSNEIDANGERRGSPPPTFDMAMALGIIAGEIVTPRPAQAPLESVKEVPDVPKSTADSEGSEDALSEPSEPTSLSELGRRKAAMTPQERKRDWEREAWLADIVAGLDLDERVRRDVERKKQLETEVGLDVVTQEKQPDEDEDKMEILDDHQSGDDERDSRRWSREEKGKAREVFFDARETRSGSQTPANASVIDSGARGDRAPEGALIRKISQRTETTASDMDIPGSFPGLHASLKRPTLGRIASEDAQQQTLKRPKSDSNVLLLSPSLPETPETPELRSNAGGGSEAHASDIPAQPALSAIDTTVSEKDSASDSNASNAGSEVTQEAAGDIEEQAPSTIGPPSEKGGAIQDHIAQPAVSQAVTVPATAAAAMAVVQSALPEAEEKEVDSASKRELTVEIGSAQVAEAEQRPFVTSPTVDSESTPVATASRFTEDFSSSREQMGSLPIRSPTANPSLAFSAQPEGGVDVEARPPPAVEDSEASPTVTPTAEVPSQAAADNQGLTLATEQEQDAGPVQPSPRPLFATRKSSFAFRTNPWSTSRVKQLLGDAVDRIERARRKDSASPERKASISDPVQLTSSVEKPSLDSPSAGEVSSEPKQLEKVLPSIPGVGLDSVTEATPNRQAALARRDLLASPTIHSSQVQPKPQPQSSSVENGVYRHPFNRATRPNFNQTTTFMMPIGSPIMASSTAPTSHGSPSFMRSSSGGTRTLGESGEASATATPPALAVDTFLQDQISGSSSIQVTPTDKQDASMPSRHRLELNGASADSPRRAPPPVPTAKHKQTVAAEEAPGAPCTFKHVDSNPADDSGATATETSSETWTEDETESSSNYSTSDAAPQTPAPYRFYPPKGVPTEVLRPDGYKRNRLETEMIERNRTRVKPMGPRDRRPPPLPPRPVAAAVKPPVRPFEKIASPSPVSSPVLRVPDMAAPSPPIGKKTTRRTPPKPISYKEAYESRRDSSPWQAGPSRPPLVSVPSAPQLNEVASPITPDAHIPPSTPVATGTGAVTAGTIVPVSAAAGERTRQPAADRHHHPPPQATPPPIPTAPRQTSAPKRKKTSPDAPQPAGKLKIPVRRDDRAEIEMRSDLRNRIVKWSSNVHSGDPETGKRVTKFPKIVAVEDAPPMVDIVGPSASVVGITPTVLPAWSNSPWANAPVHSKPALPPTMPRQVSAGPPAHANGSGHVASNGNNPATVSLNASPAPVPVLVPPQVNVPVSGPLTRYTDVDVILVDRLAGTGEEYEGLAHIEDFLGPEIPRGASPDRLSNLLIGRVEVESRRVAAGGKVKLKLSALGIRVVSCPVCLRNYKEGEYIGMLPNCGHVSHQVCATKWLRMDSRCMVCREPL